MGWEGRRVSVLGEVSRHGGAHREASGHCFFRLFCEDLVGIIWGVPADARGPRRVRVLRSVLARWWAGAHCFWRRLCEDLAGVIWGVPADARGPRGFTDLGSVLVRWRAGAHCF